MAPRTSTPVVITQSGAGWGIDRQFRLTLGLLLWIFLLSYLLSASPYVFIIPAIVCAGLIYSGDGQMLPAHRHLPPTLEPSS
ncbi:MAG: hypothetical protein R2873_27585 [Caldilineaceae bacterium]